MIRRYERYKDSGVEWIGEIPEGWEVKKVSYCFSKIGSGTTPTSGNKDFYENGEFNWLQTGDLNDGNIVETSKKITLKAINTFPTLRFYPPGSVVIAMYGATIGKTGLLQIEATTNQACCVLATPKDVHTKFAFYWLNSIKKHIISLCYGGGQPNINQEQIKSLKIQLPTKSEQTAIASFLDRKTAEIDQLIANKEKLIALYEEEKAAIINRAVTRGLDPKVKTKPSGIDWLGDIPEHWEVKRLKYVKAEVKNSFVDGPFGSNLKTEHFVNNGDVYVIDSGYITSGCFNQHKEFKTITSEHFETIKRSECVENDIIIAKIGANFGMSGVLPKLDKPSVVSGNSLKLTIGKGYDLKFIHYQLLNLKQNGVIDIEVKGSAQPALSMQLMSEMPFLKTSEEEQTAIVAHIEAECSRLDAIIDKFKKQIELFEEYRTTLISEVVTGKIDVRDEVAA